MKNVVSRLLNAGFSDISFFFFYIFWLGKKMLFLTRKKSEKWNKSDGTLSEREKEREKWPIHPCGNIYNKISVGYPCPQISRGFGPRSVSRTFALYTYILLGSEQTATICFFIPDSCIFKCTEINQVMNLTAKE